MKKQHHSLTSKQKSKKTVKYKFDVTDSSIMNVKWNSPNNKKGNTLNINVNPKKFNTIEIEDNN